jgi:hypothetical protein
VVVAEVQCAAIAAEHGVDRGVAAPHSLADVGSCATAALVVVNGEEGGIYRWMRHGK